MQLIVEVTVEVGRTIDFEEMKEAVLAATILNSVEDTSSASLPKDSVVLLYFPDDMDPATLTKDSAALSTLYLNILGILKISRNIPDKTLCDLKLVYFNDEL